jgi:hypothetical protein
MAVPASSFTPWAALSLSKARPSRCRDHLWLDCPRSRTISVRCLDRTPTKFSPTFGIVERRRRNVLAGTTVTRTP